MSDLTESGIEDLPKDEETFGKKKAEHEEGLKNKSSEDEYSEEDVAINEVQEEEEEEKELDPDDFISKPFLSEKCTLEEDILVFEYP